MSCQNDVVESSSRDREMTPKVWGCEELILNDVDAGYCGKLLWLLSNHQGSLHYHEVKDEVFMCIEGAVWVEYWPVDEPHKRTVTILRSIDRDALRLRPRTVHRFAALEDVAVLVEFSTPHSDADVVRLEESR